MSTSPITAAALKASDVRIPDGSPWARLPVFGGAAAGLGLLGSILLGMGEPRQFFHSYLVAFLFVLSLGLGALFFVLVQFATRSGWSVVVRRLAEQVAATLPAQVLLFVPVALGVHDLYHWTHAEAVAADPILQSKQAYLNLPFFYIRAAACLGSFALLSLYFRRRSLAQDESRDPAITRRLQAVAPPALAVFALGLTFAAFDWIMSLDPHWFSTIFGVYYFAGSVVGMFAVLSLLGAGLQRSGLLGGALTVEHLHDLGKLLFAFVAFWAYIAFSQYFLIWYANIPEETIWFLHRSVGTWRTLTLALGAGHFVLPFFFLLPRTIKRSRPGLVAASVWMLCMHYLDLYWLVMPTLHPHGVSPHALDGAALLLQGGLFVVLLGHALRRAPLIPVGDPRLPESLSFENL